MQAVWKSGGSENRIGLRRDERYGSFDPPDALDNAYEKGTWLLWSASSGFLSIEYAANLSAPFSFCNIILDFGRGPGIAPEAGAGAAGLRQELAIGTGFLESVFTVSRSFILDTRPELHLGLESRVGAVNPGLFGDFGSHFQEGEAFAEAFFGEGLGGTFARPFARPFGGIGIGARADVWVISAIYRDAAQSRSCSAVWKAYAGLRLDPAILASKKEAPGAGSAKGAPLLRADLIAGAYGAFGAYPPVAFQLGLRAVAGP
jgi:hypothetical protein